MTRVIYKYEIPLKERPFLSLPRDRVPLSVGLDPMGNLCMWAEIDLETSNDRTDLQLVIAGTGHPPPDADLFNFFGTVRQEQFMWHIYIEKME